MEEHATDDAERTDKQMPPAFLGIGTLIGIGAGIGLIFGAVLGNIALGLAAGSSSRAALQRVSCSLWS